MCSLLEPAMVLGLLSAVAAPFTAAFVFGVDASLSFHYTAALAGAWAFDLVAVPFGLFAVVVPMIVPVMLAVGFAKALFR